MAAWIRTVPLVEAEGELKDFYNQFLHTNGFVQNIFQALSLKPESLAVISQLRASFAAGESPLGRRKEELIYTAVSVINQSRHCSNSHSRALAELTGQEFADQVLTNWRQAKLQPDERVMLEYCEKASLNRSNCKEDDLVKLRIAGFNDEQILEIVLHMAYRHFMNIVADALGVEDEPIRM